MGNCAEQELLLRNESGGLMIVSRIVWRVILAFKHPAPGYILYGEYRAAPAGTCPSNYLLLTGSTVLVKPFARLSPEFALAHQLVQRL